MPLSNILLENEEPDIFAKKIKLNNGKGVANEEESKNPYYQKISDDYYIKGPMKFDSFFLNYLDVSTIDYVFISNAEELLILPFITSHKKFRAKILTSLPIKQIGKYVVNEFFNLISLRNNHSKSYFLEEGSYYEEVDFFEKFVDHYGIDMNEFHELYSLEDMEKCFEQIETFHFKEEIEINNKIIVQPLSSGYNLGSCYWLFQKNNIKIAILTNGSFHNYRHPSLLDLNPISESKCDLLILGNNINEANIEQFEYSKEKPYNSECLIKKLFESITSFSNEKNNNILLPVRNMLFFLDFIDILYNRFKEKPLKFFIISESLESLIGYGNANVEYLNPILRNLIFEAEPHNPFASFENFKKTGKFFFFSSIFEFQQKFYGDSLVNIINKNTPSLYIYVDSVLRFGITVKLLEAFEETNNKSTIILTDPYLQSQEVFSPYLKKFRSRIVYSPIDFNFTSNELKKELIQKIRPKSVLLPAKFKNNFDKPEEEGWIGYKEEQMVNLNQCVKGIFELEDNLLKYQGDFKSLKFMEVQELTNLTICPAKICIENEKVTQILKRNPSKSYILKKKVNEEIDLEETRAKIKEIMHKYFFLVKNEKSIEIDGAYKGFRIQFVNKNVDAMYFFFEYYGSVTKIWGSDFEMIEKVEEILARDKFFNVIIEKKITNFF